MFFAITTSADEHLTLRSPRGPTKRDREPGSLSRLSAPPSADDAEKATAEQDTAGGLRDLRCRHSKRRDFSAGIGGCPIGATREGQSLICRAAKFPELPR